MKKYYKVMLGQAHSLAQDAYTNGYIGVNYGFENDLSSYVETNRDTFRTYAKKMFLEREPERSNISIGLSTGTVWTLIHDMKQGDVIISPNGQGSYYIGIITSPYIYVPDQNYNHHRKVEWVKTIHRDELSGSLIKSLNSMRLIVNLEDYQQEIEAIIDGRQVNSLRSQDPTIESVTEFALEKHLEDFLIKNWNTTPLGLEYDILTDSDGTMVGQQYLSDTGPIDILAIKKDGSELLILELKKGRASDTVVGQIQRYMGFVIHELAEPHQSVRGIIIASEHDIKIERALSVTKDIEFFVYQLQFSLEKRI
jgi:restriction system protein